MAGAIGLVADAIGDRARLVERHVEPLELDGSPATPSGGGPEDGDPSISAGIHKNVIAGFARDRFSRMLDEQDPRFDGLAPREAARSAGQRSRLERWLRTLENTAVHGGARRRDDPEELAMPEDTLADAA